MNQQKRKQFRELSRSLLLGALCLPALVLASTNPPIKLFKSTEQIQHTTFQIVLTEIATNQKKGVFECPTTLPFGFVCGTVVVGPIGVPHCTVASATAGNDYVNSTCKTVTTGPTLVSSCTAAKADLSNNFTTTNCTKSN